MSWGKRTAFPRLPTGRPTITGIPAGTIKALAREWASKRTSIAHGNGGPGIRSAYSTEHGRLEVLLLAMQGLGKPGVHQVKMLEWGISGMWDAHGSPMPMGQVFPQMLNPAYTITDIGGTRPADADCRG